MAPRAVLAELAAAYEARSGCAVGIEATGGVDAVKRVEAGELFDVVVLAADAIDRLIEAGRIAPGSRLDLVRSGVAVAVRAGAPHPDIGCEVALIRALRAARSLGVSTGPSGVQLAALFGRWGIAGELEGRIVQAPPGVAVGTLLARGEVELGFQQLSELMHVPGIEVLGQLPPEARIETTFAAGRGAGSTQALAVDAWLAYVTSAAADGAIRRHGMEPAGAACGGRG